MVSTLTFVLSTFKFAVCYVKEEIDLTGLQKKISEVEIEFERVYRRLVSAIDKNQKNSALFESNLLIYIDSNIVLSLDVIKYIKGIKLERKSGEFIITDHLNYKNSICGLKIPLTYEEVVKNPNFLKDLEKILPNNKNVIEINQFKISKEAINKVETNQKI